MKVALNATPLIYLVKSDIHKIIGSLNLELITTAQVAQEVLKPEFPEYSSLKDFFSGIRVKDIEINNEFSKIKGLDDGEASILSMAKNLKVVAVLDDKVAHLCALADEIECYHTPFFIFRALEIGKISKLEAIEYLDKLIVAGWYCDIGTYVRIRNKIEND